MFEKIFNFTKVSKFSNLPVTNNIEIDANIIKNLDIENNINVRFRAIEVVTGILLNRKCQDGLFLILWPKINDLIENNQTLDCREYVINFLNAYVIGQYDSLGIMKSKILDIIDRKLSDKKDVPYQLELFKSLSDNGKDLTYIENQTEHFLAKQVEHLFDVSLITKEVLYQERSHEGKLFLDILSNLVKHNSGYLQEELIEWILKEACHMVSSYVEYKNRSTSNNDRDLNRQNISYPDNGLSLSPSRDKDKSSRKLSSQRGNESTELINALLDTVYNVSTFDYLPANAVSQVVTFLCMLGARADNLSNGTRSAWEVMEMLLLSSTGPAVLEDLCSRLMYLKPLDLADGESALYFGDSQFLKDCPAAPASIRNDKYPYRYHYDSIPIILASSIRYVSDGFWDESRIKEITSLPSHSLLPIFYQALSWKDPIVCLEIIRALIKLLSYAPARNLLTLSAWDLVCRTFGSITNQLAQMYHDQDSLDFLTSTKTNPASSFTSQKHNLIQIHNLLPEFASKLEGKLSEEDLLDKFYKGIESLWIYFLPPINEGGLITRMILYKVDLFQNMIFDQDYANCFEHMHRFMDEYFYQTQVRATLNEKFPQATNTFSASRNGIKVEVIQGFSKLLDLIICPRQVSEMLAQIITPMARQHFNQAEIINYNTEPEQGDSGEVKVVQHMLVLIEMVLRKRYEMPSGDAETEDNWERGMIDCLRILINFQSTILQRLSQLYGSEEALDHNPHLGMLLGTWQCQTMPSLTLTLVRLFEMTFFVSPTRLALKIASHLIDCLKVMYRTQIVMSSFDNELTDAILFFRSPLGCEMRYTILECLTSIYAIYSNSGMKLIGLRRLPDAKIMSYNLAPSHLLNLIMSQTFGADNNIKCDIGTKEEVMYEEKGSFNYLLCPPSTQYEDFNKLQNAKDTCEMTLLEASRLYSMVQNEVSPCPYFPYSYILASIIDCINLESEWRILCLVFLRLPRLLDRNKSLILPTIFMPFTLISERCERTSTKRKSLRRRTTYPSPPGERSSLITNLSMPSSSGKIVSSSPSSNEDDSFYPPRIRNLMISLTRALCNITNDRERYLAIESDYTSQCSQFYHRNNTLPEDEIDSIPEANGFATRFPSRSEFLARFTFPCLIAMVPYHVNLRDNGSETCLRLLHGLESGLSTTMLVSHEPWSIYKQRGLTSALTLACVEMSETAAAKFAPRLLLSLSKLSATTVVALPVLEFLSIIADQPAMHNNFIEDEYMSVFAIAIPYTNAFKFNHFIISLAHLVIYKWFIKCRITYRKNFIKFILKGLYSNDVTRDKRFNYNLNQPKDKNAKPIRPRSVSLNNKRKGGLKPKVNSEVKAPKNRRLKNGEENLDPQEIARLADIHAELVDTCKEVLARYAFYNIQCPGGGFQDNQTGKNAITNQLPYLPSHNLPQEIVQKESWFLPDRLQIITITTYQQSNFENLSCAPYIHDPGDRAKIHIRCVTGDIIWLMKLERDYPEVKTLKNEPEDMDKIFSSLHEQPNFSPKAKGLFKKQEAEEVLTPPLKSRSLIDLSHGCSENNLYPSPSFCSLLDKNERESDNHLRRSLNLKFNDPSRLQYRSSLRVNSEICPSYVFMSLFHNPFSQPECKDLDDLPIILPKSTDTDRSINVLDYIPSYEAYKIGVLYIARDQPFDEATILSNESGSARYIDFLQGLGSLTKLTSPAAKKVYLGGLDTEGIDGEYAYTWKDGFTKVAYHIGTLMPNRKQDPDRHCKKLHIGNDFVTIVYNESGKDYPHSVISGQFCYISIIITPMDNASNSVKLKCRQDMDMYLGGQMSRSLIISDRNLSTFVRQMSLQSDLASKVFMSKMTTFAGDPYASNWLERLRHLKRLRAKLPCKSEQFLRYRQKYYYAYIYQDSSMASSVDRNMLAENDYYTEYPI